MHLFVGYCEVDSRVVNDYIRIFSYCDNSFILAAEYLCGIFGAERDCFFKCNSSGIRCGKHIRIHILDARAAVRYLREIILAPVFFIRLERTVVGSYRVDVAALYCFPYRILTFFALHRR